MPPLRLLADDLTGALDAGAEFARSAGPVHVFWHGAIPDPLPASAALDSGTREHDAVSARAIVAGLASRLSAAAIAFKKIDSLLRGPTLAELAACFAAGAWRYGILAPAFPFQGRVTRDGRQFARDGATWRPAGPPLAETLRAEGIPAQRGQIGQPLSPGITVFDAETDAELAAIAAMPAPQPPLWSGTAGLAAALAGMPAIAPAVLPRPILGLFGSDQPATSAQLAACRPHWHQLRDDDALHDIASALQRGLALISVALPSGLARDAAADRIGRAFHRAIRTLPRPGAIIVAGGETLRGLCLALGAHSLELEGRIEPGLPRAVLRGGLWDGVTIVSKSGAFGHEHLLRDLLAQNGFFNERTLR